jgi:glycosyltransferase involved in cell wall biosynthesis
MKTPPNVLLFVGSFDPGGSESQALQLAWLLRASGRYRVHLACFQAKGALRGRAEELGFGDIPTFPIASFYRPGTLLQLYRFAGHMRRLGIHLFHAHDFYTNVFGLAAAALAGVPVRIASRRETGIMRTPAQERIQLWAYRLAGMVVANAGAVRDFLVGQGVPVGKIAVLYNGVDMRRFIPPPAPLDLPPGRRWVTMVANMRWEVKDHRTFLRAARRVRDACPEAAFALAGEGGLAGGLQAFAAELGLASDVRFLGRCERLPALLEASAVCVLSSRAEGFSNAILEYMAAARPVVSTNVGGAAEAVLDGETGYLVAAGDDADMARRIVALLRDPTEAARMGARGRERVAKEFSCEKQLQATCALYDRLLAAPGVLNSSR